MALSKAERRNLIAKALEVVKKACGGGVKGYAEGGSPKEVLSEAVRSPVPEWMSDQLGAAREGTFQGGMSKVPEFVYRPAIEAGTLGAEMTGIPSMVRGYDRLTDPESDGWGKARGAADIVMGAMPALGTTTRGAKALAEMYATGKRATATGVALGIPGTVDILAHPAAAAGVSAPTADDIRALQMDLKAKGYYKGKIDGNPGGETARAAEAYRIDQAKQREAASLEKGQDAQIAASQAASKKAEADAELAKAQALDIAAKRASEATKNERRDAGEAKLRSIDENTPWYNPNRMLRDYGPAAGYMAGMVAGPLAARGVGKVLDGVAKTGAERANKVLNSIDNAEPSAAAAKLNQFWTEGQPRPVLGNRAAPYTSNPTTGELSQNASAPPASELYLPDRMKSLTANAVPAAAFGAEWGLGQGVIGPEAAADLEKAKAAVAEDPSDINIAGYQKALGTKGFSEFMTNMGRAGTAGYLGTSLMGKPTRERPDISRAEQARFDLDSALATAAKRSAGTQGSATGSTAAGAQTPTPSSAGAGTTAPIQTPVAPKSSGANKSAGKSKPSSEVPDWAGEPPPGVVLKKGQYWDKNHDRVRDGGQFAPTKYNAKLAAKGKQNEPPTGNDIPEKNSGGSVMDTALSVARRYADGGHVHSGPIMGIDGGRADTRPISVPAGAYVVPADVVSGIDGAGGNTMAGMRRLDEMFGKSDPARADGGAVPIRISDGEYVLSPDQVARVGGGDVEAGHRALDEMVRKVRADHIKTLSSLPGPAQS